MSWARERTLQSAGSTHCRCELGRAFVETRRGKAIAGTLTRRLELLRGRFALVGKARDFTLTPWRPVFDRDLGKTVGGITRLDGVTRRIGRDRRPEIG